MQQVERISAKPKRGKIEREFSTFLSHFPTSRKNLPDISDFHLKCSRRRVTAISCRRSGEAWWSEKRNLRMLKKKKFLFGAKINCEENRSVERSVRQIAKEFPLKSSDRRILNVIRKKLLLITLKRRRIVGLNRWFCLCKRRFYCLTQNK